MSLSETCSRLIDSIVSDEVSTFGFDKLNDRLLDHIHRSIDELKRRLKYRINFVINLENICCEINGAFDNIAPAVAELAAASGALGTVLEQDIYDAFGEWEGRLKPAFEKTLVAFGKNLKRRMRKCTKSLITEANQYLESKSYSPSAVRIAEMRRDHVNAYRTSISNEFQKIIDRCISATTEQIIDNRLLPAPQDDVYGCLYRYVEAVVQAKFEHESQLYADVSAMIEKLVARVLRIVSRSYDSLGKPSQNGADYASNAADSRLA